jgi:hypothetical protein
MSEHSRYRTGLWLQDEKPMYGTPLIPWHQLNQGLVCHLPFTEGGGNKVFDLSGKGNHGTIYGATWNPGRTGPALQFDSTDDYVDLGGGSSFTWTPVTQDRTLGLWFYPTVQPTTTYPFQFLMTATAPANRYQFTYYNNGGTLVLLASIHDNAWGTLGYFYTPTTLTLNTWHHIVFVASSVGNNKIYVNGVSKSVTELSWDDSSEINPTKVTIGSDSGFLSGAGTLDEYRIYNRALSADEIWQLYTEGNYVYEHLMEAELFYAPPAGLSIPVAMHHYAALRV